MDSVVISSVLSLIGSVFGTIAGIMASSKLTVYRIEQLEKKVDKFIEVEARLNALEKHNAVQDERAVNIERKLEGGFQCR